MNMGIFANTWVIFKGIKEDQRGLKTFPKYENSQCVGIIQIDFTATNYTIKMYQSGENLKNPNSFVILRRLKGILGD